MSRARKVTDSASISGNLLRIYCRNNVPKGYSFVGLTQNLETKLSVIESIPAAYSWTRTNTTDFKGAIPPVPNPVFYIDHLSEQEIFASTL